MQALSMGYGAQLDVGLGKLWKIWSVGIT